MPLSDFQKTVAQVLAQNRSEDSHIAGGMVLNAAPDSPRYSQDFDIFHEVAEAVQFASEQDQASLQAAGFEVNPSAKWTEPETFRRAHVTGKSGAVEIDWAADSAFRFFPIETDPVLGWKLHLFDMATNKALALCARTETRDYVDILELGKIYPLAAICWAACGKDPGFSPLFLLKMMRRFAKIDPVELKEIQARNLDPIEMKKSWIEMSDQAEEAMERIANEKPDLPIGCAFVDQNLTPKWIEDEENLHIHHASLRGCLPTIRYEI